MSRDGWGVAGAVMAVALCESSDEADEKSSLGSDILQSKSQATT